MKMNAMNRTKLFLAVLLLASQTMQVDAQTFNQLLLGVWQPMDPDKKVLVEVFETENGRLSGKIIGGYDEAGNYQSAPSDRPNLIVNGFEYVGDGHWKGGKIIDPEDGEDYRGRITLLAQDQLEVRAYYGFLWKDMQWKKTDRPMGSLAAR